ncbi:hypothetical protein DU86_10595 [Methanosarcina mazei]|jgi:hypothetical protein|uniref:Uncharacterized protein n=5 Tax=Methanosarcina mazei TaxID=2209 RepID=A0A0F8THR4_METMZ|nr:hypothetical protein [Methanosarcina mazei]AAM31697.1 hypothetical protein MM_2001 [Methanosarcina mazei Go1]AKB62537.1 hypothetical protein MSMAP_2552 [Methanosarcina mazei SarPi]AKB65875.1 hypothetical protein MSMAS_2679 [Methanosarcina mazei S-6]AKB68983.1 hypothetical protein MSMAL_2440 [Methanosarcina mazei LYC]KKG02711.1 hypothetical protein DU40_02195 [Methanosarcina mazei]
MPSGKKAIPGLIFLLFAVLMILYFQTATDEKIIYEENFEDRSGIEGGFLGCEDSTLYLDTQNPARTGEGVWNKNISLSPGKISWNWEGQDTDNFSLWLKISFSDHKSIYYVAAGSRNPQSEGEFYRDEENRRRFSPSVVISGIPMGLVERDIIADYTGYCGPAENIKIVKMSAGFVDNSTDHTNLLKISDLKIHGKA